MDYSITVLATFNCRNVSGVVDFTTLPVTQSDSTSSIEGCIKYDPPQNFDGNNLLTYDNIYDINFIASVKYIQTNPLKSSYLNLLCEMKLL